MSFMLQEIDIYLCQMKYNPVFIIYLSIHVDANDIGHEWPL